MQQGAGKILKNFRFLKTKDRLFARKQLWKVWKFEDVCLKTDFELKFDLKFHNDVLTYRTHQT